MNQGRNCGPGSHFGEVNAVDKVKEKAPVRKELKEKVKTAPKELVRRGLEDGTQRLRGQLRDTAQRGQRDGYGGDQIEDAAWAGGAMGETRYPKAAEAEKGWQGQGNGAQFHNIPGIVNRATALG